jgi:hypothetical protein
MTYKWEALKRGKNVDIDRNARFNYLYSTNELDNIERKLRKAAKRCERMSDNEQPPAWGSDC